MKIIPNSRNEYIKRINEIISVLKKNDFGYLIQENTFLPTFPFLRNKEEEEAERAFDESAPARMRKVLEDLGPAYIKLGQMLSTRPDLIGVTTAKEFEKLTDNTPITPFDEILEIIRTELNQEPYDIFESIDETPLGSASIGQVHKAVLKESGEEVALKIQKPNIEQVIDSDIKIMKFMASKADRYIAQTQSFNLPAILTEFERAINKELDYIEEMINMQHLAHNFRRDKTIHIPNVYQEYCTKKILVMELIQGEELSKVILSDDPKYDKKLIAQRGVESYFKQVILDGFFHADPHPGNIIIMDDNIVCFIDEGMMGNLDESFRRNLAQLLITLNSRNTENILNQLQYMDIIKSTQITSELVDDVNDLMNRYYGTELTHGEGALADLIKIMIKHKVSIPREFINIARGLAMLQKSGTELDPEFNAEKEVKRLSTKIILKKYSPKSVVNEFLTYSLEMQHLAKNLPDRINSTLHKIENGEITVKLEHEGISALTDKLSYALIISALIIGSSLALLSDKGPKLWDMPAIGFVGFLLSACLGFYVILKFMEKN